MRGATLLSGNQGRMLWDMSISTFGGQQVSNGGSGKHTCPQDFLSFQGLEAVKYHPLLTSCKTLPSNLDETSGDIELTSGTSWPGRLILESGLKVA